MTTIEALVVTVVVLGLVSLGLMILVAALYRSRPVVSRRSSNGLGDYNDFDDIDVDRTGVRKMRQAMKLVKPRHPIANDG